MKAHATNNETETNQPAHKIRLGRLAVTIWQNAFDEGRPTYWAYIAKSYRDRKGDWQETAAFRPEDLVLVGDLTRRAADWILAREAE